ncbi:MAG: acyl-CoA dehydrogenase family protein [Myxococcota bacterium]
MNARAEANAVAEEAVLRAEASPPPVALRALVRLYGERGLLRYVTDARFGGALERTSSLALCAIRERLGYGSPLAELAFAMQGLGSYPMTYAANADAADGSLDLAQRYLPRVISGELVTAFALTERNAGTDLSGITTSAAPNEDHYLIRGEKRWISNAGVADLYVVFARTSNTPKRNLSAFVVEGGAPGLFVTPTPVLGGHPIGEVHFDGVPGRLLGEEGQGLSIALATLARFRPTVGAAAVGFAQRALDESIAHVKTRHQFGGPLADLPLVQARIGEMACEVESARLLVERAARIADGNHERGAVSMSGSMAKLVATEAAQRVIDSAVQLHGGVGVHAETIVARLYEEVRALRIYEGTNDVQKLIIARELLK